MNKLLPLAAALVLGSATFAAAENAFPMPQVQPRDDMVELGTITTDGPGVVQIYNYDTEKIGGFLGQHELLAGANPDVKIGLEGLPMNEAVAVLKVNGEVVAIQPVRFEQAN